MTRVVTPARWLLVLLATAACVPARAADAGGSVVPAKGWRYSVHATDLPSVDNLGIGVDGALYATQELKDGRGRVVRIKAGKTEVVMSGLDRPDGLHTNGQLLYVTEETPDGRVLEFNLKTRAQRVLATLNNPEGIGVLADGEVVATEDSVNGRLVRLRMSGEVETILGGLNRPEGLCVARDQTVYLAETATGRVLAFKDGDVRSLIVDLDEPDQVECAPDGALWITEDSARGRLLRLVDGGLYVILSGLSYPQGMAFLPDGTLYLAEQGRGRILRITQEGSSP